MSKLTLTIEDDVLLQAKEFAKQQGLSLSAVVEKYLRSVAENQPKKEIPMTPIVKSLSGSLKDDFAEDYKEELYQALAEKHLK